MDGEVTAKFIHWLGEIVKSPRKMRRDHIPVVLGRQVNLQLEERNGNAWKKDQNGA